MSTSTRSPSATRDADAFMALTDQIARARGVAVRSYKLGCLERRIAARMRATGAETYAAYSKVLHGDPTEYDALLDALTINVTHLFRDTDVWEAVRTRVLPALWASQHSQIHTWVAGCASGEEAYTVAALWHGFLEERGELSRLSRVRVIATDLDPGALAVATEARYPREAFRDTPAHVRARYFTPDEPHVAVADLRKMVRFERGDLLAAAQPAESVHFITCRNVLIYFDKESQDAIFARFRSSLVPGGFLVIGKTEAMLGESRTLFDALDQRVRLFQRPLQRRSGE